VLWHGGYGFAADGNLSIHVLWHGGYGFAAVGSKPIATMPQHIKIFCELPTAVRIQEDMI